MSKKNSSKSKIKKNWSNEQTKSSNEQKNSLNEQKIVQMSKNKISIESKW